MSVTGPPVERQMMEEEEESAERSVMTGTPGKGGKEDRE